MAKKTILTYYTILFFNNLSLAFFFATYALFLVDSGLNLSQINLVNLAYMATCFLMEMPTGSVADNYGRKFSFVISCLLLSLSLFVYYISGSFVLFILAEIIAGIATTFSSGAYDAWMVDQVKQYDQKFDMTKVFVKKNWVKSIATILGVIIGSHFGKIDLSIPWLLSGTGMAITTIVAIMFMKEEYFVRDENTKFSLSSFFSWTHWKKRYEKITSTIKTSIKYGVKHKAVFFIVLTGIVFSFASMAPNMFWQIRFKDLGFDVDHMGYIFIGITLFNLLGSSLAYRSRKFFKKEKNALIFGLMLFSFGLFLASFFKIFGLILAGFYLHEIARGFYNPLQETFVNEKIPGEKRATILSFVSMMGTLGSSVGLILTGPIADHFSVSAAWLFSGVVIVFSVPFLLVYRNGE